MIHFIQKSGAIFLKLLSMVLVLLAGFAWAKDGTILSADELEALIKGATRAGKYAGGTYYITFQDDHESVEDVFVRAISLQKSPRQEWRLELQNVPIMSKTIKVGKSILH
jgi:hypothetical protein